MPFGDGTGPWGEGPMTGRGLGPCADIAVTEPKEEVADVFEVPQTDRPWPEDRTWIED